MAQLKVDTGKTKSKTERTVIVTKSKEPVKSTLFAKKIKKVNALLSNASLLQS